MQQAGNRAFFDSNNFALASLKTLARKISFQLCPVTRRQPNDKTSWAKAPTADTGAATGATMGSTAAATAAGPSAPWGCSAR